VEIEFRAPSGTIYKLRPLTLRDVVDHLDDLAMFDEERQALLMTKIMIDKCIVEPRPDEIPLGRWDRDQEAVIAKIAEISELPFRDQLTGAKITEPGGGSEGVVGAPKRPAWPRPK